MADDPLAPFIVTPAQARRVLAEVPPRYGVAHQPTATSEHVTDEAGEATHAVEVTGERLYTYDLETGQPTKIRE